MSDIATCSGCERRWTGLTEAHCPSFYRHFGGVEGFDMHRRGGRCLGPTTLQNRAGKPVLRRVERLSGPVWLQAKGSRFNAAESLSQGDASDARAVQP